MEKEISEEAKILENLAEDVLKKYVEVSSSPCRTSVISFKNLRENEDCTYCAYCGKEVIGHFDVGTFEQLCDCEKAKEEHEKLLKIRELSEKIQDLEVEKHVLETDIQDVAYKNSVPYILYLREEGSEAIEEALNIYKDTH